MTLNKHKQALQESVKVVNALADASLASVRRVALIAETESTVDDRASQRIVDTALRMALEELRAVDALINEALKREDRARALLFSWSQAYIYFVQGGHDQLSDELADLLRDIDFGDEDENAGNE